MSVRRVRTRERRGIFLASSIFLLGLLYSLPATAEPLQWSVTPYLWAVDTKLDLTADGSPAGGAKISFSDLLDSLDTSFQVHVETGKGRWSGFADLTYIEASDDFTEGDLRLDTDSEQLFLDLAVVFWPRGEEEPWSFFAGLRRTDLDEEFEFRLMSESIGTMRSDRDFDDFLLGLRYHRNFSERWGLRTRGDISFGDSEGTFVVEALIRYGMGRERQYGPMVGYRYKEAEFDESGIKEEYSYRGPLAAFNFRF